MVNVAQPSFEKKRKRGPDNHAVEIGGPIRIILLIRRFERYLGATEREEVKSIGCDKQ